MATSIDQSASSIHRQQGTDLLSKAAATMILRSSWHHFDDTRGRGIPFDDWIYQNHDTYSDTKSYLDPNLNLDIEKLSQAVYRYGRSFIISRGNKKDRLLVKAEFDENIGFTDVKINKENLEDRQERVPSKIARVSHNVITILTLLFSYT